MKNAKKLRITSILFIVWSVLSVILMLTVLNNEQFRSTIIANAGTVLDNVALNYAICGLEIVAGIVGLALANKSSKVTVFFGILTLIEHVVVVVLTYTSGGSVTNLVVNAVLTLVPIFYLLGALGNLKEAA